MHFLQLLTILITYNFLIIEASPTLGSRRKSKLVARDVPNCPQQPGYSTPPPPSLLQRRIDEIAVDRNATKGQGWVPSTCGLIDWVCIVLTPNVTYASYGKPGSGHIEETFQLDNGNRVQVIWYWQATVQYTAPLGTVNIYLAHGTNYVCLKGVMAVKVLGFDNFYYYGNPDNLDELLCYCHWQPNSDPRLSSDNNLMILAEAPRFGHIP
ncbi:hypothetical protein CROQUDRAFT_130049 [Cronartium quercuum f. sp. fusiforme G11]|uniref:Uncharacterized protein n=1 Tax=Cronartium quercuum f. sp. fusiforme G11 TaxID=708437 RepID=A0A9P6NTH9_9BASI|nr:hypothetical protein CROQUDRAFT_130049 [Cronartium quercuum f. sp. fusiforme G11]